MKQNKVGKIFIQVALGAVVGAVVSYLIFGTNFEWSHIITIALGMAGGLLGAVIRERAKGGRDEPADQMDVK